MFFSYLTTTKGLSNIQYLWTEYSKDLSTYLQYCRDVVFAGLESSFENHEEEKMMEYLRNIFKNEEVIKGLNEFFFWHA